MVGRFTTEQLSLKIASVVCCLTLVQQLFNIRTTIKFQVINSRTEHQLQVLLPLYFIVLLKVDTNVLFNESALIDSTTILLKTKV